MRVKCYKNEHAMYEVKQSVIPYKVILLVIVVECGYVGIPASGIYDVDANSPNMPLLLLYSPHGDMNIKLLILTVYTCSGIPYFSWNSWADLSLLVVSAGTDTSPARTSRSVLGPVKFLRPSTIHWNVEMIRTIPKAATQ